MYRKVLTVAIMSAELASMAATAGDAVHWADTDAGVAKEAKWLVVQPSALDFTIQTKDINGIDPTPKNEHATADGDDKIGVYKNAGDGVYIDADNGLIGWSFIALGNYGKETLAVNLTGDDGTWHGSKDPQNPVSFTVPARDTGKITGSIYDRETYAFYKSLGDVKSTRFTANLVVTKKTI